MKSTVSVTIKYFIDGQLQVETYPSLLSCAKHYQVCIPTLKKVINDKDLLVTTKNKHQFGTLPIEAVYILDHDVIQPPSIKHEGVKMWHCDLCQKDICQTSKTLHLMSLKHRQRMVGEVKK